MDLSESVVTSAVNLEWLNAQGIVLRKVKHKVATMRLIRNDVREIFVEISTEKSSKIKLLLKDVIIHKKFMHEGKASIKFNVDKCILYLSNAPTAALMSFLRTLIIKMGGEKTIDKEEMQKNIRAHMLSGKPSKFEDISPVTNLELQRAKNMALPKASTTTPSPPNAKKRRLQDGEISKPVAKKLYTASPLITENEILNDEQNEILQACINGNNVFFTGSAGTGKSFLLRKIIAALPPDSTIATASTGVAACLIGGVTLHSFAGIGDGEATLNRCYDLAKRAVVSQAWRKCKTLIIDEISMVDGAFFEKIENVARHIRRNDKPFGGVQLILCGDFFQLPPVQKSQLNENNKRFCFQTSAWEKCINISYELKIVHRQKDKDFVNLLNHIRIGHVTDEITKTLLDTSQQTIEINGILATQLCSHTNDAKFVNETKLENLKGESMVFDAQDSDPSMTKQLDTQVPAPGKLELKVGAQVMLLKNINISNGLVNGARGIIISYKNNLPVVKFKNNFEYLAKHEKWIIKQPSGHILIRRQIPLRLAWAFSIHKSQGLTLDCVEMSLSKVFEAGQAYVALSRAKNLSSLRILDFNSKQVWANPEVLKFYKNFRRKLQNISMVPLGGTKKKKLDGQNLTKLQRRILEKPLININ